MHMNRVGPGMQLHGSIYDPWIEAEHYTVPRKTFVCTSTDVRGRSYEIRKTHKDITIIVCHQGSRKRTNKGQVQLGVHAFLEFLLVGDSADLGLHKGVPHVGEERNTAVLPVQGLAHIRWGKGWLNPMFMCGGTPGFCFSRNQRVKRIKDYI